MQQKRNNVKFSKLTDYLLSQKKTKIYTTVKLPSFIQFRCTSSKHNKLEDKHLLRFIIGERKKPTCWLTRKQNLHVKIKEKYQENIIY